MYSQFFVIRCTLFFIMYFDASNLFDLHNSFNRQLKKMLTCQVDGGISNYDLTVCGSPP